MPKPMNPASRQRYLADLHVGVLSVATSGHAHRTLSVPIWYQYEPDVGVTVITSRTSPKGIAIEESARFGLTVQTEEVPYAYVSVEGPVVSVRPCELERDILPMAQRYLGADGGRRYAEQWNTAASGDDHVFVMEPERWWTADFASDFADSSDRA